MEVELILINGDRRKCVLPGHSGSSANAIDRLDDWVPTIDGGWVQKQFIVEVRPPELLDEASRSRHPQS